MLFYFRQPDFVRDNGKRQPENPHNQKLESKRTFEI